MDLIQQYIDKIKAKVPYHIHDFSNKPNSLIIALVYQNNWEINISLSELVIRHEQNAMSLFTTSKYIFNVPMSTTIEIESYTPIYNPKEIKEIVYKDKIFKIKSVKNVESMAFSLDGKSTFSYILIT